MLQAKVLSLRKKGCSVPEGMLAEAGHALRDAPKDRVQLIRSSVCDLPLEAESHDAVLACAVGHLEAIMLQTDLSCM
eukprot:5929141-Amphidinium_carterae.2